MKERAMRSRNEERKLKHKTRELVQLRNAEIVEFQWQRAER